MPRINVGSQFPEQGLNPGCSDESTKSSPLDHREPLRKAFQAPCEARFLQGAQPRRSQFCLSVTDIPFPDDLKCRLYRKPCGF